MRSSYEILHILFAQYLYLFQVSSNETVAALRSEVFSLKAQLGEVDREHDELLLSSAVRQEEVSRVRAELSESRRQLEEAVEVPKFLIVS